MFFDSHAHLYEVYKKDPLLLGLAETNQTPLAASPNSLPSSTAIEPASDRTEPRLGKDLFCLDVGITLEDVEERRQLRDKLGNPWHSLGLYPSHAALPWSQQQELIQKLRYLLSQRPPGCLALGEIGLDYYRSYAEPRAQTRLLEAQLEIAQEFRLPVILHNRQADEDLCRILETAKLEARGIFHCFSGTRALSERALDLGYYLSFAGNVSYPSNQALRDVIKALPLEHILAETDCPYLSPQGLRQTINFPARVQHVYKILAECKGLSIEAVETTLEENARRCLRQEINHPRV